MKICVLSFVVISAIAISGIHGFLTSRVRRGATAATSADWITSGYQLGDKIIEKHLCKSNCNDPKSPNICEEDARDCSIARNKWCESYSPGCQFHTNHVFLVDPKDWNDLVKNNNQWNKCENTKDPKGNIKDMMVSKKIYRTYKCTKIATWQLKDKSWRTGSERCNDLGMNHAGPFGEPTEQYHLFYQMLDAGKVSKIGKHYDCTRL